MVHSWLDHNIIRPTVCQSFLFCCDMLGHSRLVVRPTLHGRYIIVRQTHSSDAAVRSQRSISATTIVRLTGLLNIPESRITLLIVFQCSDPKAKLRPPYMVSVARTLNVRRASKSPNSAIILLLPIQRLLWHSDLSCGGSAAR